MEIRCLFCTARSAVIEINDGGRYETQKPYDLFLNGKWKQKTERVITNVYGLKPDTEYAVQLKNPDGEEMQSPVCFRTKTESCTLNVHAFGARGDGSFDDTPCIQAAILACPADGRVLIPAGKFKISSLFLKSNLNLELSEGAELSAVTDRDRFPVLPGLVEGYDEKSEYNFGTWEGNPLDCFSGIITGLCAENIVIYGQGKINGNASPENWWNREDRFRTPFRPRMLFLNHCRNVSVQGLFLMNSPSWTIHPYFCSNVHFYGTDVRNPAVSPNTDGLDPESCERLEIIGMHFSLGDDCIAVKSGKIYMGKKYKTASQNISIRQCLMEDGHGAVTLGSEMAAGVKDLTVSDCVFRHTDRGLRIKTRRGRGEDAVIDRILFQNIEMDYVKTPLVVNSFYFCDPDGHTDYVQSRDPLPVDERTPEIRKMSFEHLNCRNCQAAAAYITGLPEKKIEEMRLSDVHFQFGENAESDVPAMAEGVTACLRKGIYAENIKKLILKDVTVTGHKGDAVELKNVDETERD
jgi:polygalacturonase